MCICMCTRESQMVTGMLGKQWSRAGSGGVWGAGITVFNWRIRKGLIDQEEEVRECGSSKRRKYECKGSLRTWRWPANLRPGSKEISRGWAQKSDANHILQGPGQELCLHSEREECLGGDLKGQGTISSLVLTRWPSCCVEDWSWGDGDTGGESMAMASREMVVAWAQWRWWGRVSSWASCGITASRIYRWNGCGDTQGEGNVKTEAKTGAMRPQSKECPEPPEAGKGKEGAEAPPEGVWWLTLALWPLVPGRNVRLYVSVTLSYSVCGILLWQPHGTSSAMVGTWKNK